MRIGGAVGVGVVGAVVGAPRQCRVLERRRAERQHRPPHRGRRPVRAVGEQTVVAGCDRQPGQDVQQPASASVGADGLSTIQISPAMLAPWISASPATVDQHTRSSRTAPGCSASTSTLVVRRSGSTAGGWARGIGPNGERTCASLMVCSSQPVDGCVARVRSDHRERSPRSRVSVATREIAGTARSLRGRLPTRSPCPRAEPRGAERGPLAGVSSLIPPCHRLSTRSVVPPFGRDPYLGGFLLGIRDETRPDRRVARCDPVPRRVAPAQREEPSEEPVGTDPAQNAGPRRSSPEPRGGCSWRGVTCRRRGSR